MDLTGSNRRRPECHSGALPAALQAHTGKTIFDPQRRATLGVDGYDIRLALRRLAATPLFTAFAILSLAAGVAITTAMYSIVDGVFLRGQGIRDPDRVAVVVTPYSGRLMTGVVSEPDFRDLRRRRRRSRTCPRPPRPFAAWRRRR